MRKQYSYNIERIRHDGVNYVNVTTQTNKKYTIRTGYDSRGFSKSAIYIGHNNFYPKMCECLAVVGSINEAYEAIARAEVNIV